MKRKVTALPRNPKSPLRRLREAQRGLFEVLQLIAEHKGPGLTQQLKSRMKAAEAESRAAQREARKLLRKGTSQ